MTDSAVKEEITNAILIFAATCVVYLKFVNRHRSSNVACISAAGAEDWEQEEESGMDLGKLKNYHNRESFYDLSLIDRSLHISGQELPSVSDLHDHFEHPDDNPTSRDLFRKPKRFYSTSDLPSSFSTEVRKEVPSVLPKRLILIRHGQSEGNVNQEIYSIKPDNALRLTNLGWDQAHVAGNAVKNELIGEGEPVHFIISPYVRTTETLHGLLSAWCNPEEFSHIIDEEKRKQAWYECLQSKHNISWHEDPRIREQDFGNYQNPEAMIQAKRERNRFGAFYYRFPNGESASDVFDRVSTFLDSLWRSFHAQRSKNYVIVTHGISIRVVLSRYFRYTIDQFHTLANPKNCEMIILGHDGLGKLQLNGRCELVMIKTDEQEKQENIDNNMSHNSSHSLDIDNKEIFCPTARKSILRAILFSSSRKEKHQVVGFKFYNKLRTLPPQYITKRQARISRPKN